MLRSIGLSLGQKMSQTDRLVKSFLFIYKLLQFNNKTIIKHSWTYLRKEPCLRLTHTNRHTHAHIHNNNNNNNSIRNDYKWRLHKCLNQIMISNNNMRFIQLKIINCNFPECLLTCRSCLNIANSDIKFNSSVVI